tara:strand:- start:1308 stop:1442 length:135 start_codon:yes stop_codon:yes gene_type:complete
MSCCVVRVSSLQVAIDGTTCTLLEEERRGGGRGEEVRKKNSRGK